MEGNNEQVLEFISAYEKYPVLRDPKHTDHKNRNKLNDGWAQLQNEFSAEVEIAELKRKKESLMSTYQSLRKKVVESEKSGQGNAYVYKPSWFAYGALDRFLRATGIKQPSLSSEGGVYIDITEGENDNDDIPEITNEVGLEPESSNIVRETLPPPTTLVRKRKREVPATTQIAITKHLQVASDALQQTMWKRETEQQPDAFTLYGQLVAEKLKNLQPRTCAIIQNKIDNLLFEALLSDMDKSPTTSTYTTPTPLSSPALSEAGRDQQQPRKNRLSIFSASPKFDSMPLPPFITHNLIASVTKQEHQDSYFRKK